MITKYFEIQSILESPNRWEEISLQSSIEVINELMVNSFNTILTLEKYALKQGPFNDLTVTELHAIEAIGLTPQTMTEVANKLKITVGSLTVTINRTVKKGYVLRQYTKADRRCVEVSLTHKGKLAYRLHESFHSSMVKRMLTDLDEADCEVLIKSLKALTQFFREEYSISNG